MQQFESALKEHVLNNRSILAMAERSVTMDKRFDAVDTEPTKERRWVYRELRFAIHGLSERLPGGALFNKTISQKASDDTQLLLQVSKQQGIITGIKVDESTVVLPLPPARNTPKVSTAHMSALSHREWA